MFCAAFRALQGRRLLLVVAGVLAFAGGAAARPVVETTGGERAPFRSLTLSTFDQLVISDGASHAWRLNETSGTTGEDAIGTSDMAGVAPTWGAVGPSSGLSPAAAFMPEQKLAAGAAPPYATDNFTAEIWFLTTGGSCLASVQQVMGIGNFMRSGATGWGVYLEPLPYCSGPGVRLKLVASLTDVVTGGSVAPNTWHHLVVSRSSGTWSLYLDGALLGTSTSGSNASNSSFWVAQDFWGDFSGFYLHGRLSRAAFYPVVLSASEVGEHFEVGRGATQAVEQTYGVDCGGRGSLAATACGLLSDPVNTLTGALTHSETDVSLASSGVPFELTRTYTSADPASGRFGPGWTDTYQASLAVQPNGDVIAKGDEGQRLTFVSLRGAFDGGPGARGTLLAITGGYRLTTTDQLVYEFDTAGKLLSKKDRNGQGVTLAYDGSGRLSTVTDSASNMATFSYDASNLVDGISLSDGRSVAYGYTSGRLTSFTDPRGKGWTYTYDARGRLETIVDPLNNTQVTNVYDQTTGRVTSQTDATNKTTTFAWDAATQTATVTDPNNHVWKDVYVNNVLAKRVDGTNKDTEFDHDGELNPTVVESPSGEATTMTYDAKGNVLTAKAPPSLDSATKTFVYNAKNDPTTVTDARNKVTTYTYTAAGNVETVTQDGVLVASYTSHKDGSRSLALHRRASQTGDGRHCKAVQSAVSS